MYVNEMYVDLEKVKQYFEIMGDSLELSKFFLASESSY